MCRGSKAVSRCPPSAKPRGRREVRLGRTLSSQGAARGQPGSSEAHRGPHPHCNPETSPPRPAHWLSLGTLSKSPAGTLTLIAVRDRAESAFRTKETAGPLAKPGPACLATPSPRLGKPQAKATRGLVRSKPGFSTALLLSGIVFPFLGASCAPPVQPQTGLGLAGPGSAKEPPQVQEWVIGSVRPRGGACRVEATVGFGGHAGAGCWLGISCCPDVIPGPGATWAVIIS